MPNKEHRYWEESDPWRLGSQGLGEERALGEALIHSCIEEMTGRV